MAELNYCGVCGERLDLTTGECPRCRQNTEDSAGSIGEQRSVQAHDSRGFDLPEDGSSQEIDDWKSFRGVGRQRIQEGDTLLNRNVIQAKLGSGGMGVV